MDEVIERIRILHQLLMQGGFTLSTAESCTGGKIADMITEVGGASRFFIGSVVAYHKDVKVRVLGVGRETIKSHGVVSAETAIGMAKGVSRLLSTDVGLSTTGNLGPEALEGKEVGLIFIGLSMPDGSHVRRLKLNGQRRENKREATIKAVDFLIEKLKEMHI